MKQLLLIIIYLFQANFLYASEITQVEVADLNNVIEEIKSDKMVLFFTSWCKCCIKIIKDLPINNNTILVSLDHDASQIDRFVKELQHNIYYLKPTDDNLKAINHFGFTKTTIIPGEIILTSYPYIVLLNENNEVMQKAIGKENVQLILDKYLCLSH